jgi:hypothetical protein
VNRTPISSKGGPITLTHKDVIKFGFEDKYEYKFFVGELDSSEVIGEEMPMEIRPAIPNYPSKEQQSSSNNNELLGQENNVLKERLKEKNQENYVLKERLKEISRREEDYMKEIVFI